LGVNWDLSNETGNASITAGRDLPWLQDTVEENVQGAWGVNYRDLVFVDPWNRKVISGRTINLDPDKDNLEFADNRDLVKETLRQLAMMTDADDDGIADDWEERYYAGLAQGSKSDTDGDGEDLLLEYGLGSHPGESVSLPMLAAGIKDVEGEKRFSLSFRRRLGTAGGLSYLLESRDSSGEWADVGASFDLGEPENPYDGTGTEIVTFVATGEVGEGTLYRVRLMLP